MPKLLLVRHEEAHPASDTGDALRTLTTVGRRRMYKQATGLFERLAALDRIWTSPLVRAVQTAEILVSAFDSDTPVIADPTVVQPPSLGHLRRLLESGPTPLDTVAMVGHEPTVSAFARYLTHDAHQAMSFRTGQAILLVPTESSYQVDSIYRGGDLLVH